MIKNEKQYKITKSWLRKFEEGRIKIDVMPESKQQPWLRQAQRGSLDAQIEQLKEEIEEYEALSSGKVKVTLLSIESIIDLPILLIKRRIANGWTLQTLAEKLGMHWQQLQRYEQTDYASANLQVIQRVTTVLSESGRETNRQKSVRTGKVSVRNRAKA
jgi:hypothetical protein